MKELEASLFKEYRLNNGGVVNNNNNNGDSDGNYRSTKESFFFINSVLYAPLGSEILSRVPHLKTAI
jgi:hypothetical protein